MTTIMSYPFSWLDWEAGKITHATWPVIIDTQNRILLHVSSTTEKYQFIGWRLDDTISMRENALARAEEVLWHRAVTLSCNDPLLIFWEIERNGDIEKLLLSHYKAKLNDENNIWDWEWKTLEEIQELANKDMLSSPNVLIAVKHFLK